MSGPKQDEAADAAGPETADDAGGGGPRASSVPVRSLDVRGSLPGPGSWLPAVVVLLVLAAAVVSWLARAERLDDERSDEAQREVGESLVQLLSWDYKTVSAELAEEKKLLTGDFADDYAGLVESTIAPSAAEAKLSSTTEIVESGLIRADGDRLELLFFLNVTVAGPGQKDNAVGSRIKVSAVERDGRWLIEKYDPI